MFMALTFYQFIKTIMLYMSNCSPFFVNQSDAWTSSGLNLGKQKLIPSLSGRGLGKSSNLIPPYSRRSLGWEGPEKEQTGLVKKDKWLNLASALFIWALKEYGYAENIWIYELCAYLIALRLLIWGPSAWRVNKTICPLHSVLCSEWQLVT